MGIPRWRHNTLHLSLIQEEKKMNYIYDIHANFQDICYDFYEWNKNDKIIRIKKIPIFIIDHYTLKLIIRDEMKIDLQFLTQIKDKTIIYNCKNKITACLFTDSKDVVAVKINIIGNIIRKSSLLPEEELDILEAVSPIDIYTIKFEHIQILKKHLLTRYERERKKFILRNIFKIEDNKLFYLYFECFNLEESNRTVVEQHLKKEINSNNNRICSISYNFLKLIYANS